MRCFPRIQKILSVVCDQGPVIMLARSIDSRKRLFVQKSLQTMLSCHSL